MKRVGKFSDVSVPHACFCECGKRQNLDRSYKILSVRDFSGQ